MAEINIRSKKTTGDGWEFTLVVVEDDTQTSHAVSLKNSDWKRFADRFDTPEDLIKQSFYFLLEREPKESILAQFDLMLIGKYFPEYKDIVK